MGWIQHGLSLTASTAWQPGSDTELERGDGGTPSARSTSARPEPSRGCCEGTWARASTVTMGAQLGLSVHTKTSKAVRFCHLALRSSSLKECEATAPSCVTRGSLLTTPSQAVQPPQHSNGVGLQRAGEIPTAPAAQSHGEAWKLIAGFKRYLSFAAQTLTRAF